MLSRAGSLVVVSFPLALFPALQEKPPSFAGHWVMTAAKEGSTEIPPICRLECVITQDPRTLVVKTPGGETIQSYTLDGIPIKSTLEVLGRRAQQTLTARWQGQVLVLVRVLAPEESPADRRESELRVFLEKGRLVFERTTSAALGSAGRGRGDAPVRFVYERRN